MVYFDRRIKATGGRKDGLEQTNSGRKKNGNKHATGQLSLIRMIAVGMVGEKKRMYR